MEKNGELKRLFEEKHHLLTFIADSVQMHLNYLNPDLEFVFVNKSAASYWNLPVEGMIGKTIHDLAGKEGFKELKPFISRVLRGERVTHEFKIIKEDGEDHYFLNEYIPDLDSEGKLIGFVALGTDITEHKNALNKAEKLAAEFRILADSMPQIVWTANPDGHVDYYNKRWYEFTGLPEGSADNNLWIHILHPDDAELLNRTWTHALETGDPYEVEFRVKEAKSGEYRWLLSRARSVKDSTGKIIKWYGSNTDIHDQKRIQSNLENEKSMREQFVSTLSHDLRTPLTSAKMSAQLILRKNPGPPIQKLAFRIEENMDRADQMIKDLLDVSQLKAGIGLTIKRESCNLSELAHKVIDELSQFHGDRLRPSVQEDIVGEWDCDGLRRILENLVSNALKYGDPTKDIFVKLKKASDKAVLEVVNFGNPIQPNDIPTLFEAYKRSGETKRVKGWGIGLSLVKGLTESHGGEVSVSSSEDNGTRFKVSIPYS